MTVQSPKKKILLLEDNPAIREVARCRLESQDYVVMTAGDGIQGLEILGQERPHVILLDVKMPRMDGFDLTRNIRSDERTRHIPIIMITSRTATKHRNYAMELGVNEYLGKPYQESDLLRLVGSFVSKEAPVA